MERARRSAIETDMRARISKKKIEQGERRTFARASTTRHFCESEVEKEENTPYMALLLQFAV